jgi:protein involved in polysaccharide export with SLBB domain
VAGQVTASTQPPYGYPAGQNSPLTPAAQAAALSQTGSQGITAVLASATGVTMVLPPRPVTRDTAVMGIPIDGDALVASQGAKANLVLQNGDVVVVPQRPTTVTVLGAVARSGAVVPIAHGKVGDYIDESGGFREDADHGRIILVHANGAAVAANMGTSIRPGDVIVVPSRHIIRNVRVKSVLDEWLETIVPLVTSALIVKIA